MAPARGVEAGADREVLCDAEPWEDTELLVDEPQAGYASPRGSDPFGVDTPSVDSDRPAVVGTRHAGEDLQQRGLAGPVAAHQRVDLGSAHRERHVGERTDTRERLRQALDTQRVLVGRGHRTPQAFSYAAL